MAKKWFLISADHKIEDIAECQKIMTCVDKAFVHSSAVWEDGAIKLRFDFGMTKAIMKSYLRANFGPRLHVRDMNPEITAASVFRELARKTVGGADIHHAPPRNTITSGNTSPQNVISVDFRPR